MTNRRASDLFPDGSADERPPASSLLDPAKLVREGQRAEQQRRESIEGLGRDDKPTSPHQHVHPEPDR